MSCPWTVLTDRSFDAEAWVGLAAAARGREPRVHDRAGVAATLAAYPFVAHVRDDAGSLVACCCAFAVPGGPVVVGSLLVHPDARGRGLGASLLDSLRAAYPDTPVVTGPLRSAHGSRAPGSTPGTLPAA
jgi:GNAT superfamily N-acetyltransferase